MQIDKHTDRLRFFSDLYQNAKNQLSEVSDKLRRHYEQYKGSDLIDGSTERASAVRNITYEIVESQVNSDIPAPKVEAKRYSLRHDRNATDIERLLAKIRDELPFEELNDIDERYTYIFGGSIWLVEWDSDKEDARERGGVRVSCISPTDFFPQPHIYRIEDMEYCFLRFTTTREELSRRYGVTQAEANLAATEETDACRGEEDTVTVVVCFWRDEAGEVSRFVWSGDAVLSDIEHYYGRKKCACRVCGKPVEFCTCETPRPTLSDEEEEVLTHDILLEDGTVILAKTPVFSENSDGVVREIPTRVPYYRPKCFPIVIRKNTSSASDLLGQSDCEFIRPEQQQINKIESRIMQKLMRSGITPLVPEDATVTLNNAVFGQVIRLRPGESAANYGTVDTTPNISQDIAQAERLYEHAKRIIGISDAYQGLDTARGESGYSRQIRIQQAAGRLESKRRMKYTAYAAIDRLIFSYYLAYADEPRHVTYTDSFGVKHASTFNRYDFLEYDPAEGRYYYDDGYLFSVDLSGGPEQQREEMWEKNLKNLQAGTLGDPADPATLLRYWQNQERAHYPFARENVTYFFDMIKRKEREKNGQAEQEILVSDQRDNPSVDGIAPVGRPHPLHSGVVGLAGQDTGAH